MHILYFDLLKMENVKITIRNYRSIPFNNPVSYDMGEGITFILGVNNIGKSNLIKIFHELKYSFQAAIDGGVPSFTFNSIGNTVLYSSVKNQRSEETKIEMKLEFGAGNSIQLEINPNDTNNLDIPSYNHRATVSGEPVDARLQDFYHLFANTMYVGSFRTPTFQTSGSYYDIEIGNAFIIVWDAWATGTSVSSRTKIRTLKNELKELFGFNHFDIYPNHSNTNFIVETDDGSFNLDELGGGISHFILVLANALIKEPAFILIDEPENGLHPKMQETFVRILASKAKYGLVATSHSIGLARSVGADKIYSLSKNESGKLLLSRYGENYKPSITNAINELGYSQFVELGGNNILLVEGVTDIKCFKEILRKYGIEQHFIIMDLGGSSLISEDRHEELSDVRRLNAKSYNIIFDSEITEEGETLKKKFQDFKNMCEGLNFNVFVTEFHSTDNYITQAAIDKELGNNYTALGKYENLNNRPKENKWGKSLNWRMFREMDKSDFEGTDLDEFISQTLVPLTE